MPDDTWVQIRNLAVAGTLVAAIATPVAVTATVVSRQSESRLAPRWRHRADGWTGFDILFLFFLQLTFAQAALSILVAFDFVRRMYGPGYTPMSTFPDGMGGLGGAAAAHVATEAGRVGDALRGMWAGLLAAPPFFFAAAVVRFLRRPSGFDPRSLPGHLAVGAFAWAAVAPAVFTVNFIASDLIERSGGAPESHPFTSLGGSVDIFDRVMFGFAVCFVTPLVEEFLFRGLLVRWAAGRRYRPWTLMMAAVVFAIAAASRGNHAPLVYAVGLAGGLLVVQRAKHVLTRFPGRTAAAVYSSSALFAAAHSAVWPSPVPLFLLGLALGYLTARTGGIAAAVTLHGLFNAVSFVYLLRGGT